MKKKVISSMENLVMCLDILFGILILIGVIMGLTDVFKYYGMILASSPEESFIVIQQFLSHVLLLVIGLEFVSLLIKHDTSDIIEVILLAVARKLLIASKSMIDILIAIIALACILAMKKFLLPKHNNLNQDKSSNII